MNNRKELFEKFLPFMWLRPENALLLSLRAERLQSTFEFLDENDLSADIACGDGVFSFLTMGGELSFRSDMYQSIDLSETVRTDEYDHFDEYDDDYSLEITQSPKLSYTFGTDWKANSLKKARHLGFYDELLEHDNNEPLPCESKKFGYVYTNSAYFVENFEQHLRDLVRITEPGGHIVLQLMHRKIVEYTSSEYADFMGERFHQIIDAGRLSTWRSLRQKQDILAVFDDIEGALVESVKPVFGGLPVKMWDIGFRPLFSPLAKMANGVGSERRLEVKEEWCQIIFDLFSEYLGQYDPDDDTAVEHQIVIQKPG